MRGVVTLGLYIALAFAMVLLMMGFIDLATAAYETGRYVRTALFGLFAYAAFAVLALFIVIGLDK